MISSRAWCVAVVAIVYMVVSNGTMSADVFSIHNTSIEIPPPKQFVMVTEDMPSVFRFMDALEDPFNDTLALYVPEAIIPSILDGENPNYERWFVLKVNKDIQSLSINSSQFGELREVVRTQYRELLADAEEMIPELAEKSSQRLSDESGYDVDLDVGQMVPLAPHFEDHQTISYSMFVRQSMSIDGERDADNITATSTTLNAAGKVLLLYSYGNAGDLEWTREASVDWANEIANANDAPPERSSGWSRVNWSRVLVAGVVGAMGAGLASLARRLFARRRRQNVG